MGVRIITDTSCDLPREELVPYRDDTKNTFEDGKKIGILKCVNIILNGAISAGMAPN